MNTKELAANILQEVGGESNVASLVHCATRLRFKIVDINKVNMNALNEIDGVITAIDSAGQIQVVIGNRVSDVYMEFGSISSILSENKKTNTNDDTTGNILEKLVDIVSSIFTPLLGAMAASGVLKGVLSILTALDLLSRTQNEYIILSAASDSIFYFLPVLLAITSSRKFGANTFVSVSIAGAMIYPTIQALYESGQDVAFFGIPVILMKYTGSVLPIILCIWVTSYLEKNLKDLFHDSIRNIVTPFLLVTIMVPLALMCIGPVSVTVSTAVADIFVTIYKFNPIIAGALFAAFWQIFVIFGIHWGFVTLFINDLSILGRSYLKAATGPAVFSQSGALLAVMVRTKDEKMKALAGAAFITSLFGITEPGVYGVTLKLKKPFICAVIAAGCGGAIVGYAQSSAISMGMTSLLTVPIFYGPGFTGFILGCLIAFVVSFILTLIVGFQNTAKEQPEGSAPTNLAKNELPKVVGDKILVADKMMSLPIKGEVIALESVDDKVFSSGAVGDGIAIIPAEGRVYAPTSGIIAHTYNSGHAIGLLSDTGAEILIHVGIDTIQLQGKYFTMHVKEGDRVVEGQLLIEFDKDSIVNAGYQVVTPFVITNIGTVQEPETSTLTPHAS
ncbi:PTS system beta-glucoside-specific EIIBCA component [Vibrio ruber DSM 16370]|uniref:PTS system beta-glucoside-specific EIIBCA component n=1 Tax=Vibrio ruber (strain DSM 16370 / JCM 11486 / BCRC 17186 / CECT 7878 / LMG 23124 / VR1) TaxID=1123498 RepID=A0A1R4LTG0_VIBR1|nr:beta-glucoside-specific PTS transporter subunit IIABC [Vibrio ruber]SJN59876.1 PTS system beta-glucoside-specific EIIBCA component [Vibrio ruber DSM 16370]